MAVDGVQPTPSPGPKPGPRPAGPPLAAYDADSLARCRRGAGAYCLAAGVLVVGEYVGTAVGTGRAAGLLFDDKLTLFVAVGVVAVVITAVLQRRRWREFLQTWALAAAHREAREREKRYRSVVETAGSIIIVLTPQGSVTEFNREAERVLGWPQAAAVGRDLLTSFVAETSRATVAADIRMALAGEATHAFEAGMLARDGRAVFETHHQRDQAQRVE